MDEIDCDGLTLHSDTGELLSHQITNLVIATEQQFEAGGRCAVVIVVPWHLARLPARVAVWNEAKELMVAIVTVECSTFNPEQRTTTIEGVLISKQS